MGLLDNLSYETVQIVRIRNVRVALIYHLAQLAILGYVIGYGLIYKKTYQATGQVSGSADIKPKGVAYVNQSLPWNGPGASKCSQTPNGCFHVYDIYDLVMPPMEENALFVTSNMWVTKNQTRDVCPSYGSDNVCDKVACEPLKAVNNGRQTGLPGSCRVNYTDPQQLWPTIIPPGAFCDVYAWCPTELELLPPQNTFRIQGVRNFTIFVRMNVNYPKWGIIVDNTAGSNVTTNFVNLWTLENMVNAAGWKWSDIERYGTTIAMNAVWDCNFDQSIEYCTPRITFVRLDDPNSKLSSGFNFRSAEYLHDQYGARQVTKHYGVRLIVLISGVGAKADPVALLTSVGAGLGLLSVATLIADFIATNLLQNKNIYKEAKFKEVEVVDPPSDDEKNSSTYRPPRKSGAKDIPGRGRGRSEGLEMESDDDMTGESWGVAKYPVK